jgi:hypothetical protein
MFALITFAAAVAVTAFGYIQTRGFVRRRLAYVDAAQGAAAPVLAAAAAFALAVPAVALLPFVGGGTAVLFAAGVGTGFASGVKDTRRRRLSA